MITCRKATFWISRNLDGSLPLPARLVLGTHLAMCRNCHRFRRQLRLIDQAATEWLDSDHVASSDETLRKSVAEMIAQKCYE